jgi:hypothetical protein
MTGVVELASFRLKKGTAVSEFIAASDKFQKEFLSKQKGHVSRQMVNNDDKWMDIVIWKSMDDAQNAVKAFMASAAAAEYCTFLDNENCSDNDLQHFTILKSY